MHQAMPACLLLASFALPDAREQCWVADFGIHEWIALTRHETKNMLCDVGHGCTALPPHAHIVAYANERTGLREQREPDAEVPARMLG